MISMVTDVLTSAARRLVHLGRAAAGREVFSRRDVRLPTQKFGNAEGAGGWVLYPMALNDSAVVYSAGVGTDISFEVALAEHFNLTIHTFDPTPTSERWLRQQHIPPQITHHSIALAEFDGMLTLHPPANPDHVSFSQIPHAGTQDEPVTVPARRLSSILDDLGHTRLDVLKIDIEGSEYGVVSDILASGLAIDQLLVEFHHRFDTVPITATRDAVRSLRHAGFALYHVSPRGEEYSFIHTRCLDRITAA